MIALPQVVLSMVLTVVPATDTELLAEIDALRTQNDVAAAVLVLVRGQQTFCEAVGVVNHDTLQPATTEHFVRIGSITKAFTGLALLAAAERGELDLDEPIHQWLSPTPFNNPWAPTYPVTLAMLMEHSAGLAELSGKEWDSAVALSLEEALALDPGSRTLRWRPGLYSVYSNSGAGIAAYATERKLGVDFERWTRETVFAPLRMDSASFEPASPLLTGYNTDGTTPIPYWHQLYRPFGAMNVKPCEMANFLKMLIDRGKLENTQILQPETVARMERPTTTFAARRGVDHGYGFGNYAYVADGRAWHGHGGDADGYLSFYAYNHDCNCGYFAAITAFQHATLRKIRTAIERHLQPPLPDADGLGSDGEINPQWFGTFTESATRFGGKPDTLRLNSMDGKIRLSRGAMTTTLKVVDAYRLRRPRDPVPTIAIGVENGVVYLQGPFGNFQKTTTPSSVSPEGREQPLTPVRDETPNPTDSGDR